MTKVSASCRSTRWLSQILSNSVRGLVISTIPSPISLRRGAGVGRAGFRLAAGALAAALDDARRLAGAAAQVVELGAPDLATAHHLDRGDTWRVEREDALDAFAVGDLAQ